MGKVPHEDGAEQGRAGTGTPTQQETPEHFQLIEQEMQEIRSRMAPELSDLRKRVEPQAVKEQAKRGLQERLRGVFRR